jgi:muramoyltetrapeptide carboxypeptidase
LDPQHLEVGEAWLRDLGFEPRRRTDLLARRGYLAGDDERRAAEFMELVDDPRVDGILAARGGYGCHRIMSRLDPQRVRRAAKPLMGYSDITTLLLWQRRCAGLMGFHGPMLNRGEALSPESREALARAFRGEPLEPLRGRSLVGGRAEGRLTGGSLSLAAASLGSSWEIDTRGAILLFEEVCEEPYAVDRMIQQLRAAGKLDGIAGVGVGQMTECDGTRYPEPTVDEVLEELLRPLGVPVVVCLPFGHCDAQLPWPVGGRAAIDGDGGAIELLESGVQAD